MMKFFLTGLADNNTTRRSDTDSRSAHGTFYKEKHAFCSTHTDLPIQREL